MKLKYFGTDGVRGVANQDLSPELAFRVGRAGGYVLTRHSERSFMSYRTLTCGRSLAIDHTTLHTSSLTRSQPF